MIYLLCKMQLHRIPGWFIYAMGNPTATIVNQMSWVYLLIAIGRKH